MKDKIKAIRAKTGLSQKRFAAEYGIPIRTYEDWERGIASPPPYVVTMLGRLVDIDTKKAEA